MSIDALPAQEPAPPAYGAYSIKPKRPRRTKSAIAREVLSRGIRRRRAEDLSVFDLMRDQIGIIETGAGDLASNPKHLEGFGG